MSDGINVSSSGVSVGTAGVVVAADGAACCCACFRQLLSCVDNSESGFWLDATDIPSGKASAKYSGICYHFGECAAEVPDGDTQLDPGDVTFYTNCAECNPGEPCTNCATGTTPAEVPFRVDDLAACILGSLGGDNARGPTINGTDFTATQNVDTACVFDLDEMGSFGTTYTTPLACVIPEDSLNRIKVGITFTGTGIVVVVFIDSDFAEFQIFEGFLPLTAPFDCSQTYVIDNTKMMDDDTTPIGGTLTIFPDAPP